MPDPFFDTNIVIDWLKQYRQAAEEMSLYRRHRISPLSWSEVLAAEPVAARERVRDMIAPFEIVELDEQAAALAADIRHRTRIKLLDAFILATAQVHGAMLITRNTEDFPATLSGVRVPYTL